MMANTIVNNRLRYDNKSPRQLIISIATLVCLFVVFSYFFFADFSKYVIISAFFVFLASVIVIARHEKTLLSPILLFLASFYLFQNGQLLLYSFNIIPNDFYINKSSEVIENVCTFSSISAIVSSYAAILVVFNPKKRLSRKSRIDELDRDSICKFALLGFAITAIVALFLAFRKFTIALSGGYSSVRAYEETISSVFNFIEYMFVPFSILSLIYLKNKWLKALVFLVSGFFFLLTALSGDRTTGITGLIVLFLLYYLSVARESKLKLKRLRIVVPFVVLLFFALMRVAYFVRSRIDFSIFAFFSLESIVDEVSEIGFSFYALTTMMIVVPSKENFLYGKGYFLSMIGGVFPSFLDPTGTIQKINAESRVYSQWQSQYFNYDFGLGFSLNAESYINFGWFGLLAIFLLCLFIFRMLSYSLKNNEKPNFSLYKSMVLLMLWFTLPRRDTYFVWKSIIYAIAFIYLYLLIFCKKIKRGH